jgi:hypothetical protein
MWLSKVSAKYKQKHNYSQYPAENLVCFLNPPGLAYCST